MRQVLEEAGFVVHASLDVWIAGMINAINPDLIVLDVEIGHSDGGPSCCRAIRKSRLHSGLKIILHSSRPRNELRGVAEACGADSYIQKLSGCPNLVPAVRALLNIPNSTAENT
jgi:DNA-binding response OmpR family regulator